MQDNSKSTFYAHGKLLLSGEYFVMDGAKALAIPTKFGQHFEVRSTEGNNGYLFWNSFDELGNNILSVTFDMNDFKTLEKKGEVPHYLLQDALRSARNLRKEFLMEKGNVHATARLEFSMGWGLGSSSTLIQNIASWAQVDVFDLFFSLLEGSGYDIACASAAKPIVYQLNNSHAVWHEIDFSPSFASSIFFVYLGKKQNSQQAVRQYRNNRHDPELIRQISGITERMTETNKADEFISLIRQHETIVSSALRLEKVQDVLFRDFPGGVKSLGAWGGDFVMAVSKNDSCKAPEYFAAKGYNTIFSFDEIILRTK